MIPNQPGTYGISKRLSDDERKRLRKILDEIRPAENGLIVRTAADGASADELARDLQRLPAPVGRDLQEGGQEPARRPAPPGARPGHPGHPGGVQQGVPGRRDRRPGPLRGDPALRRGHHPRAGRPGGALRRRPADLRALPRPRAAPQSAGAQGVAAVGRLDHHRADRGADRHRRQHGQERRPLQPGGDGLRQQPGGGRGGRPSAAAAGHRRDHRHRLHRHGDPEEPGGGRSGSSRRPWPGTRPGPRSSRSPSSAWSR